MDLIAKSMGINSNEELLELQDKLCKGLWRLKPNLVHRIEDDGDGSILYDPDADIMTAVNRNGTALLRWSPDRISYSEWVDSLSKHYKDIDVKRIQNGVKQFLTLLSVFVEPSDV